MSIETRRGLTTEIRAEVLDDGARAITLHCIRPNVVDDYGSLWNPHCFDESLLLRMPTLCWSHDWSEPLGRGLSFEPSDEGPQVKFRMDDFDDVPMARRAFSQVRSGTIDDCSVGFSNVDRRSPTEEEEKQFPGVKEVIEKADLDEVSLVLKGAVPGAKVLATRSVAIRSGMVDEELVVTLAKKVNAGELTREEAKEALVLATVPDEKPEETPEVEQPSETTEETDPPVELMTDAEINDLTATALN